ncbi:CsbD family protein, partial [Streptomyces flavidovirens]
PKAKTEQVKGKVKEATGRAVGDESLETEGRTQSTTAFPHLSA